jgi:hypothetical protein
MDNVELLLNQRESLLRLTESLRDENKRLHEELMLARAQLEHVLAGMRQLYERVRAEQEASRVAREREDRSR